MKNYDEATCVKELNKKASCEIVGSVINVLIGATDLGNGSWGKVDFLRRYCGYKQIFVKALPKLTKKTSVISDIEDTEVTHKRRKKGLLIDAKVNVNFKYK